MGSNKQQLSLYSFVSVMTLGNVILKRFSSRNQILPDPEGSLDSPDSAELQDIPEPEGSQDSQYVLAGAVTGPRLEQDLPPVRYIIIPIPEGPGECLHQIEVKYQAQGGFYGTMTAHMRNGLFLAVVLGLLTSGLLYVTTLVAAGDIQATTSQSQDSNWTTAGVVSSVSSTESV